MTTLSRAGFAPPTEPHRTVALAPQWFDGWVVLLVGVLMTLGVVMVYSASVTLRGAELSLADWRNSPLRQSIFAFAGFLAMLIFAHVDYHALRWEGRWGTMRAAILFAMAALLLALAIFVPDPNASGIGGQRAVPIPLGGLSFSFQAAEFAKVALVIVLAGWLSRPQTRIGEFRRGFVPAVAACGVLIGLTGVADFGTAALMGAVMFCLLLLGGARWLHLVALIAAGLGAAALLVLAEPYRLQRILTFLNQTPDASKEAYQITQSLIAIGSGGWWGRGLGAGVQKYGYLPQDNNDFIFAIVCEELGIAGGLAVAMIFLLLLWRGWRIGRGADCSFGRLLAFGLTLMICLQAAFNIGVVTHALPTKGISLPFVSAGGSGVLFLGIAAGLLAAVGRSEGALPRFEPVEVE